MLSELVERLFSIIIRAMFIGGGCFSEVDVEADVGGTCFSELRGRIRKCESDSFRLPASSIIGPPRTSDIYLLSIFFGLRGMNYLRRPLLRPELPASNDSLTALPLKEERLFPI